MVIIYSSQLPLEGGPAHRAEWVTTDHRCAGILPTTSGGQESLIPYELLLSFLFPRQPLLLCLIVSRSTFLYFLFLLYFLHFPVLPVLSSTSPPKILLSNPAPGSISSVLPFLSLYPFLPYFLPFPFTLPSRTSRTVLFFFPFFTGIFLKSIFKNRFVFY